MAKTLYVGNLPWEATEQEVSSAFEGCCQVLSCRIILDRDTGRSRGFGFVEVPDEDVEKAVEAMNGTMFGGREMIVNEAKPRQPRF